ncbi:MAG: MATE family efflux transporter [Deltaproteobacteria bacterium]|nr:MATE family efflux transporter [Deltaproteobacteria bacterium]
MRAVSRIAAPAALAQLGMMFMGVVDTAMLGRFSANALAAGALGHNISMGVIILAQGVLMALDALVSQAWGAGDMRRVRQEFHSGVILALLLSVLTAALLWPLRGLFDLARQPPAVAAGAGIYTRAVIAGVPAYLLFVALRRGLQAMAVVRPTLVAIVAANVVNVAANYVLIFGHFGLPRLGVLGSGIATSISRWSMLLALLWLARSHLEPLHLARRWRWPGRGALKQFLRIGVPISVHTGVEFWMIAVIALMMGTLGTAELAGHQIALVLAAMTYMISLGISGAAAARVGHAVGAGDERRARVAAAVSVALATAVMSVGAAMFVLAPGPLSRFFTDEPEVLLVAGLLIPIAALFQVFDGIQVAATGALRGLADTRAPAIIAVLCYWLICIPFGLVLTFRMGVTPQGPWWGLSVGLAVSAVLLTWRLWRKMSGPIEAILPSGG